MATLLNQAACLNNEGVVALMEGRQTEAFDALCQSIKLLKVQLSVQVASGAPNGNLSSSPRANNDAECCFQTIALPSIHDSAQSVSYVYNQVFRLENRCHCLRPRSSLNDDNVRAYTAAVIFNMALIHHRNGSVVKAEKLYVLVCTLLTDAYPSTLCPCMARMVTMVRLASINNVSQIRLDCGDYEATREALTDLASILRDGAELAAFQDPDMQGLVLNILLFKAPSTAAAA